MESEPVLMTFINDNGDTEVFIGKDQRSIYQDTEDGKKFGGIALKKASAQLCTIGEACHMGVELFEMEAGKKAILKGEQCFHLKTIPALVKPQKIK